ncbi:MAG: TonB-dependent receptor, partial [Acidobacteria bacterium]|nr:TonB-dependent receptor [Acidobacteriota bacterium]
MRKRLPLVLLALFVSTANFAYGQAVTASSSLAGTITDKSGAVVVGANVTATEVATNTTRRETTNSLGAYRFDVLAPGAYIVKATMKGFATVSASNVELLVSRTTTQDFSLSPGSASETVEVNAEPPVLDVEKTSIGVDITPTEVENLPLNGRDFANLAILAPGAKPVNSYDPTKNRIAVFGINGSNGRNVNVTVNGVDDKDNTVGGPVMQLPLEAVQEFNISTERFSAVNGRSEGAAVNVITKSGTNKYHGSLYFFDTETALNANDYFSAKSNQPTPDFSRQQFGGSAGGPVRKDADFLFFAWEHLREHTAIPVTAKAFSELSLVSSLGAQASPTIPTPYFDTRYNGRYDHIFNQKHSAFLSYTSQGNNSLNDQSGNTNDLTEGNFTTNQLQIANLTVNSLLTPRFVNAFTFGFQYWNNVIDSKTRAPLFTFPGSISFGTNTNVPQQSYQRKFQLKDDLSYQLGNHGLKWGVDYLFEPSLGGYFEFNSTLEVDFNDYPSVILGKLNGKYPQGFATPGAVVGMSISNGDPKEDLPGGGKMLGLYFQDDWKASRKLTLNLGLRYDRDFNLMGTSAQQGS